MKDSSNPTIYPTTAAPQSNTLIVLLLVTLVFVGVSSYVVVKQLSFIGGQVLLIKDKTSKNSLSELEKKLYQQQADARVAMVIAKEELKQAELERELVILQGTKELKQAELERKLVNLQVDAETLKYLKTENEALRKKLSHALSRIAIAEGRAIIEEARRRAAEIEKESEQPQETE